MLFNITIDSENAAFTGDNAGPELARILRNIAERVSTDLPDDATMKIYDVNGNAVGRVTVER